MTTVSRSRWAAIGAAVAVTLGAGGIGIANATTDSSEGAVSAFFPIEPCRLASNEAILADSSVTLDGWGMTGDCDLPNDITGLAANVTAVGATQQTNLRFYAEGGDIPDTANLNPSPGAAPTPNAVNITLNGTNGQFNVYNRFGTVAVFIDVMGYYDDHTHDDRYYTEAEVDAALAAARTLAVHEQAPFVSFDTAATDVATATIEVPAAGTIIATGFTSLSESNGDEIGCGIFADGEAFSGSLANFYEPPTDSLLNDTVGSVRHFEVEAGSHTIDMRCQVTIGTSASTSRSQLSLLFIPG